MNEKTYAGTRKPILDISSATLHIIAMISMLIDHSMKTVITSDSWIFVLGRVAFPVFAFMAAEGYFYTHNFRKYVGRILVFAVLSEVPYDLMKTGMPVDMYDQNVLWTFLLALICMRLMDLVKLKGIRWLTILGNIVISLAGIMAGMLFVVDYSGMGVFMVLIFYFFRERKWWSMLIQFILLAIINIALLGGMGYGVMIGTVEFPLQGFALLALIPIWLYHGRQGYHSKPSQYICYAFYPVHMLLLFLLSRAM
jgi:hypothetical protein